MRVESPFFDKGLSRFILPRARGLGILTFSKIKKTAFIHKIRIKDFIYYNIQSFCQNGTPLKKTYSKFFLWDIIYNLSIQNFCLYITRQDRCILLTLTIME